MMAWGSDIEPEAVAAHHSDTRNVTVTLGTGNFKFVTVETCDSAGNAKTVFSKGESVYLNVTYRNDGTSSDAPLLTITDVDKGTAIKTLGGMVIDVGKTASFLKVLVGSMPSSDWHIRLDMTP